MLETTIAREDERSTHFLKARGFAVVGHSIHLSRDGMDDLPDVHVPTGPDSVPSELGESRALPRACQPPGSIRPQLHSLSPLRPLPMRLGTRGPASVLFVFDPHGRVVGVMRASRTGSDRGYLNEIRIEPSSRGVGDGHGGGRAPLPSPGGRRSAWTWTLRARTRRAQPRLAAGFTGTRHWLHFLKQLKRETKRRNHKGTKETQSTQRISGLAPQ